MILLVIEESIALDEVVREIEVEEAFIGARTIESSFCLLWYLMPMFLAIPTLLLHTMDQQHKRSRDKPYRVITSF